MKKSIIITIITAIVLSGIISGTAFAKAKTINKTTNKTTKIVASERVGRFSIRARQRETKSGTYTYIYWNGKVIIKYNFSGRVQIIPEGKLSYAKLRARKGKVLYIERCVGTVTSRAMDGITTNGGYISYRCLKGKANVGDVIVTYFTFNPYTRSIDGRDDRCDAILY